jgi:membrane-associated phospholipid phosphatase
MTVVHELKSETGGTFVSGLRRWPANILASFATLLRAPRFHPQSRWLWPLPKLAIAAAVFGAVLLLVLIFTDAAAITAARTLPEWVTAPFDWFTDFGKSGWFLWPLGILFAILAALPRPTQMARLVLAAVMVRIGFLFVTIAVPGLLVNIAKQIIGRARPFVPGIADPYVFKPFSWGAAYASMPSGHATTAFSVLVAFGIMWPRWRMILWTYALLMLASRVVVTAHHPTDVLAGALVGAVFALMVRRYFALRGLGFAIGYDGIVLQKPGPSLKRIKSVARALWA